MMLDYGTVIEGKLYISDLVTALSQDFRSSHNITHVLSVCQECDLSTEIGITSGLIGGSDGPVHKRIPVKDSEFENILIQLPDACNFIRDGIDLGEAVLVHCVAGVSRSATCICAYLMHTTSMRAMEAIEHLKQIRPTVHPNYGFLKQLEVFEACHCSISDESSEYITWKRKHRKLVSAYVSALADITTIIPGKLHLCSEIPPDTGQVSWMLQDMCISHFITVDPSYGGFDFASDPGHITHRNFALKSSEKESLLLALPGACLAIDSALDAEVLIHCDSESRACLVACAYLMYKQHIEFRAALQILQSALPLFDPSDYFIHQLEIFQESNYAPTASHPVVMAWTQSQTPQTSTSAKIAAALESAAELSKGWRASPRPRPLHENLETFSAALDIVHATSILKDKI